LMWAAKASNPSMLLALLPASDPNAQNDEGQTALMIAIRSKNNVAVKNLAFCSDLSITDNRGSEALGVLFETEKNHVSIKQARPLFPGSDPMRPCREGEPTPCERALMKGNWELLEFFLPFIDEKTAEALVVAVGEKHFPIFVSRKEASAMRAEMDSMDISGAKALAASRPAKRL